MKKIIKNIIVILAGMFMLTACSNTKSEEVKTLNYDTIFNNLSSEYADFVKENDTVTEGTYSVDLNVFKSHMVVSSSSTASAKMYAIFEIGDNKEDSENEFAYYTSTYKKYWTSQGEMYNPEDLELINNGETFTYGNYLIYIVNDDPTSIYNKIIK